MSTEIEQRIVEMKFDNKGFSDGVKDTLKDLDELNKGLEFKGGQEGLKELQRSASNVEFSTILNGIQSINDNLENMQSVGFRVFTNLINKATDWAEHMVKSLSVDRIDEGFRKYEDKTETVKTLMSALQLEGEEGQQIVYDALQDLNNYSDATIYSLSDMTTAVKRFVNEGAGLDESVTALKGLSNAAALAGASTENARTAMDQLSFSMSQGYVALRQWRSIARANIGTEMFREQCIQTALALGTLVETEEGFVSTTVDGNGKMAEAFGINEGFTESLKSKWLSKEVLVETLAAYADETTEFGQAAYEAATKVNTFHKMMTVLKEQVSTGWTKTFELMFGKLDQATEFWTGVKETIGGFLKTVADTRNGILEIWSAVGGHNDVLDGLINLWEVVRNIAHYIGLALETIFGHRTLENFDTVKGFFSDREGFLGNFVIIKKISDIIVVLSAKFKYLTEYIRNLFDYLNEDNTAARERLEDIYWCAQAIIVPLRFVFKVITGIASKWIPVIAKVASVAVGSIIKMISKIGWLFTEGELQLKLWDLADFIVNVFGGSFQTAYDMIVNFAKGLAKQLNFKSVEDMLGSVCKFLTGAFSTGLSLAIQGITLLGSALMTLLSWVGPVLEVAVGLVAGFVLDLMELFTSNEKFVELKKNVTDFFSSFFGKDEKDAKKEAEKFKKTVEELTKAGYDTEKAEEIAKKSGQNVTGVYSLFEKMGAKLQVFWAGIKNNKIVSTVLNALNTVKTNIKNFLNSLPIVQTIKNKLKPLTDAFEAVFGNVKITDQFKQLGAIFMTFFSNIDNIKADNLGDWLKELGKAIKGLVLDLKDFAQLKFGSLKDKLKEFWGMIFPKKENLKEGQESGISAVAGAIKETLKGLVKGITDFNWQSVWKILKGLISVFIIKKLVDFFSSTGGAIKGLSRITNNFGKLIGNVADVAKMTKWEIAAEAFKTFATGVLELVGAIVILSMIPKTELDKAIEALMCVGMIALAFMWIKAKFIDATVQATMAEEAAGALGGVIGALRTGLKNLGLAALVTAIGVVVLIMIAAIALLLKITPEDFKTGIIRLVEIAAVIVVMAGVLVAIDQISTYMTKRPSDYLGLAATLLAISISISIMAKLCKKVGRLDWKKYLRGLGLVAATAAVMLGIVTAFAAIDKAFKGINLTLLAGTMILFAIALAALVIPIIALSLIPADRLVNAVGALIGIASAVMILFGVAALAKKLKITFLDILSVTGNMVILAAALEIFALGLGTLLKVLPDLKANMTTIKDLVSTLSLIILVLSFVGMITPLMLGLQAIATGLLTLSAAVFLFSAGAKLFADAVVTIADNMDTVINAVSGREDDVIHAVSTIVYALVKGLIDGLVYMLAAIVAGLDDAVAAIDEHAESLGYHTAHALGGFINGFINGIDDVIANSGGIATNKIADAIEESIKGLGKVDDYDRIVREKGKRYAAEYYAGWTSVWSEQRQEYVFPAADIYNGGAREAFEEAFDKYREEHASEFAWFINSPELVKQATEAGNEAAQAYIDAQNGVIKKANETQADGWDKPGKEAKKSAEVVKEASDSMSKSAEEAADNTQTSFTNIVNLAKQLQPDAQIEIDKNGKIDLSNLLSDFNVGTADAGEQAKANMEDSTNEVIRMLEEAGIDTSEYTNLLTNNMSTELANGESEVTEAANGIATGIANSFTNEDYNAAGGVISDEVADGVGNNAYKINDAAEEAVEDASDVIKGNRSKWSDAGYYLDKGLAEGISKNGGIVKKAAKSMMEGALSEMKKTAAERSPSKITYGFGYYLVKGLANGVEDNDSVVNDAANSSMKGLLAAIMSAMCNVTDMVDDELQYSPTISPVLDSSNIQYGMNNLNSLLNGSTNATLGANLSIGKVDVGSAVGELSSLTSKGNNDLLSELRDQARRTEQLIYLLENQKIYLDGTTLVGKTVSRMDAALGQRAILAGRRG